MKMCPGSDVPLGLGLGLVLAFPRVSPEATFLRSLRETGDGADLAKDFHGSHGGKGNPPEDEEMQQQILPPRCADRQDDKR